MTPWWYIAYRSEGMFLGGVYLQAPGEHEAEAVLAYATGRGWNPGGEARVFGPLPPGLCEQHTDADDRERLLTLAELSPDATWWDGHPWIT